eukprot:CAMPEP_0173251580 /NCGR_PEP_ID=MMETSP1142-20121109/20231_1 /TAXON_ID=483371 /ORGANISM="non described non described, Strain CCMP2298" /LENGTH=34 /DNA_ID= /DNA_START= /DNA_END= /DNA_ORIENTATION=
MCGLAWSEPGVVEVVLLLVVGELLSQGGFLLQPL